jgi:hypothetical protein
MKRAGHLTLSVERQQTLEQDPCALQSVEDLSVAIIHTPLSDLRQSITRCRAGFREAPGEQPFPLKAVALPLLICSPTSLHIARWLTPTSSNRARMSLRRAGARIIQAQNIQHDPLESEAGVATGGGEHGQRQN